MKTDIIVAGFGGQGILLMGKVLAQAAMVEGLHTTFLPSYGPEMRGGTANCAVVVANEPIAAPVLAFADVLVAMNQPSYDKFAPRVRDGGTLIVNSSLATPPAEIGRNVRLCTGPFTALAGDLGDVRISSMVALGCTVRETGVLPLEAVIAQMRALTARRPELAALNEKALQVGFARVTDIHDMPA